MADREDADYGLVMPFVTVTSEGGPHDDESYVCGYEMGNLDALLEATSPALHEATLHAANLRQADLIAMHHGYRMTVVERDGGEWIGATFERLDGGR